MFKKDFRKIIAEITGEDDLDVMYPPEGLGDLSTNVAFRIAKREKRDVKIVAEEINNKLISRGVQQTSVVAGFINKKLSDESLQKFVAEILKSGDNYANNDIGKGKKINIEFVSANPVGPLTLGNGRSAAYGDTLARIFEAGGYDTTREYFINDIGRQVVILGESIARRYLELGGELVDFPEEMYQGEYIKELAKKIKEEGLFHGDEKQFEELRIFARDFGIKEMLNSLKLSLGRFGINYDVWFSEKILHENRIQNVLNELKDAGLTYEKDGATWFSATKFGLDKDAVIIKSTGQKSYLLADFAYAQDKAARGFDKNIYILGADHYGDVPRIKAGVKALGLAEDRFDFLVHQLVTLKRGEDVVRMSKRAGNFVTLDELMEEIPVDTIKFFYLLKSLNEHIDFDLELAKEQSSKNPIFYIQYAYARASSILVKAKEAGVDVPDSPGPEILAELKSEQELNLVRELVKLPELLEDISGNYQVHNLAHWLLNLAGKFHKFYDTSPALSVDEPIRSARLALVTASKIVIGKVLGLLGLSSPEKM